MPSRYGVKLALCAVLGLVASCGGGDSTSPPVAVSSVTVSLSAATVAIGATVQATAVVRDANGAALTGRAVTWSSSNPAVLTIIASTGVATAVSIGSANIIATSEGVTGQAAVIVTPPPVSSVAVTLASASVVIGTTVQASAVPKDASGATLAGRTVTWSSSNPAVATVATNGLVLAVAAGSANIIATSEGVNGQAGLTVTAPPAQITGLTLTDPATGTALDLSKVAGTVSVKFSLQLGNASAGVVVVRIDGKEFARQPVTSSIVTERFVLPAALSVPVVAVDVPVSVSNITYSDLNGRLSALPDLVNGLHQLAVEYIPAGATQPATSAQSSLTTATPDVYTGRIIRSGTLRPIGGASWSSDDMTAELLPIRFGPVGPSSASGSIGDYFPDFRFGTPTAVVDIFAKSATDILSPTLIAKSALAYESRAATGSRMFLKSFAFGSTVTLPQTAEPNLNGNCIYTGGSGFIPDIASSPALPPGCFRWVSVNAIPQNLLGNNGINIYTKFYHDTKAPVASPSAFTLPTRITGANQSVFGSSGLSGYVDNWIGGPITFDKAIDRTRLIDRGSGLDPAPVSEFHYGTSPAFPPSSQTILLGAEYLPETNGQRTTFLKAGVRDAVGNLTYVPLTTSASNPFTTNGQLSSNFGVDPAIVGVSRLGGSFVVNGPVNSYVTRSTGSLQWNLTLSGSLSGYASNGAAWIRAYSDDDPTKVVYGDAAPSQSPWWLLASGSTTSSSSMTYGTLVAQAIARRGGTGEGPYTITFGAFDRAGNTPTGSPWGPFTTIFDATPPAATITGSGPFTSGSSATVHVSVTDNVGIAGYAIGPVFDFPNAGFQGGFAYAVPGQIPVGTVDGPMVRSYAWDITDMVPSGLVFYNPASGVVDTHVYNTIGVAGYVRDWAYNYSPAAFKLFPNTANIPVPADPPFVRFSVGGSSGCNGTGCAGGASSIMSINASWDSPSTTNPFNKYELYALSGDGRVNFLRTAPVATRTTLSASLYRYTTNFTYDWSQYCSTTGNLQLFGLGQSLDRKFWYKPSIFSPFNLSVPTGGNPYCTLKHAF